MILYPVLSKQDSYKAKVCHLSTVSDIRTPCNVKHESWMGKALSEKQPKTFWKEKCFLCMNFSLLMV